jgi:hypothetical protein
VKRLALLILLVLALPPGMAAAQTPAPVRPEAAPTVIVVTRVEANFSDWTPAELKKFMILQQALEQQSQRGFGPDTQPVGETLGLRGSGWTPGLPGEVQFNPVIGTFMVGDDGSWTAEVTIPVGLPLELITARTSQESSPLGSAQDQLPALALPMTGADSWALGISGWASVLLGLLLLAAVRFRSFLTV